MKVETWTKEKIEQLIINQAQENLNLEYKGAGALENTNPNIDEISKDVSAMANSDGGTIIYGIKENKKSKDEPSLPLEIEPINQSKITKEWLEQIITSNIHPPIDGLRIFPINFNNNNVVYVVNIPKSYTAHQAKDKRYHKRNNFITRSMDDYEIRDVMGRNKHPKFELSFKLIKKITYHKNYVKTLPVPGISNGIEEKISENVEFDLFITAKNTGSAYAKYINAIFYIPSYIIEKEIDDNDIIHENDTEYCLIKEKNTTFDYLGYGDNYVPKYGPSRYEPILPGLSINWKISLKNLAGLLPQGRFVNNEMIKWKIYADNATPCIGEKHLEEIDYSIKREK